MGEKLQLTRSIIQWEGSCNLQDLSSNGRKAAGCTVEEQSSGLLWLAGSVLTASPPFSGSSEGGHVPGHQHGGPHPLRLPQSHQLRHSQQVYILVVNLFYTVHSWEGTMGNRKLPLHKNSVICHGRLWFHVISSETYCTVLYTWQIDNFPTPPIKWDFFIIGCRYFCKKNTFLIW